MEASDAPTSPPDSDEITVTAQRIYRRSSDGSEVTIDLSENDDVVTSVNRTPEMAGFSGTSFSIVTERDMRRESDRTLAEVVEGQPGVSLIQNGGPGSQTSVLIRGANADQTAVLIDGIRVNNPVGFGGSGIFDFSTLTPMNLQRISILRGPNSTLYGSQAMGGAIDMQVRKGQGTPTGSVAQEVGAGERVIYRTRLQSQGSNDKMNYAIAAQYQGTEGLDSSALPNSAINEPDGLYQTSYSGRYGYTPNEAVEVSLVTIYDHAHARTESFDFSGTAADARPNFSVNQTVFVRPKLWVGLMNGLLQSEAGFAYIDQQNQTSDSSVNTDTHYNGRSYVADWKGTIALPKYSTTVLGVDYRVDTGEAYGTSFSSPVSDLTRAQVHEFDVYAQQQIRLFDDRWITNAGGRLVVHELFDTTGTWHVDSTVHIRQTGTQFKASIGTGYKAPTLYQLYAPPIDFGFVTFPIGNNQLSPEESLGWDAGVIQSICGQTAEVGATFFYNYYREMILYDTTLGQFQNQGRVVTKGVELSGVLRPVEQLELKAAYTYLDSRNYSMANLNNYDKILARRPSETLSLQAGLDLFQKRVHLNTELLYTSTCWDDFSNTTDVQAAWTWNLGGSWQINKHLRVYGRLNNLLGQNASRAANYQTPAFNGFGGVEVSF